MMLKKVQRMLAELGEAGCYFIGWFVHAYDAGWPLGLVESFAYCVARKWIHYDPDNPSDPNNCYIDDPDSVVSYLMGGRFTVRHETADYVPQAGEIAQARYEYTDVRGTHGHFVAIGSDGAVIYDGFGVSNCVARGKRVSTRVAKKL